MRRREFLGVLGGTALRPAVARAQPDVDGLRHQVADRQREHSTDGEVEIAHGEPGEPRLGGDVARIADRREGIRRFLLAGVNAAERDLNSSMLFV